MIKKITAGIFCFILIISMCACSSAKLKGKWVSDYDQNTVIELLSDKTIRVTALDDSDFLMTGSYSVEKKVITININWEKTSEKFIANYKIKGRKLILTDENGVSEQFTRST